MGKIREYKSKESFDKTMAYIHMHSVPHHQHKFVEIAGHKYKPSHKKE